MIFVGVDWAEAHHDICVMDEKGYVLGKRRISEGIAGLAELHALIGSHADEPEGVIVGIEIDRGLLVTALVASGYQIYAVNPMASSRYRDRHHVSGAKSDPGDAKMLADLVRTDRHNHRQVAGDSELAEAVKVLARAHQNAIWARQRQVNALRSALREYYPGALVAFGTDLASTDAVGVLAVAPTAELGRQLSRSKLVSALRRAGRQRNLEKRAEEIQLALRSEQLGQPAVLTGAYGAVTASAIRMISHYNTEIAELEGALSEHFEKHPDAKIIRSLPGLGTILGARVLAEFGDDRTRYADGKSRRNYAGTSPITKASGKSRVVLARFARNRRLADALDQWAFCSITKSPGARRYYDQLKSRDKTHHQALRQLANRWVGILHGCLEHQCTYDEERAWPDVADRAA
ncbi:MAG TPA: IS110 family transposase [Acidimicrobiales bacterium]